MSELTIRLLELLEAEKKEREQECSALSNMLAALIEQNEQLIEQNSKITSCCKSRQRAKTCKRVWKNRSKNHSTKYWRLSCKSSRKD